MNDAILAIDGGQTSTAVWLGMHQSKKAFYRQAPGFHYSTEPTGDNSGPTQLAGIETAIASLLTEASCSPQAVKRICCSLSGQPQGLQEFLKASFPNAHVLSVHDSKAAYAGTLWETPGVTLVGGTGSVALGFNNQRWLTVGGWGYLFGDVGGGWGIAQRALSAAIVAHEKRGPESALPEKLLQLFGRPSLRALAWDLYEGRLMRRELGRATPLVLKLAEEGDHGALGVAQAAAGEYAGYIRSLCAQLRLSPPIQVGYTGGVLAGSPYLISLIAGQLQTHDLAVAAWHPGSALTGSALMATEATGVTVTQAVIDQIHALTASI